MRRSENTKRLAQCMRQPTSARASKKGAITARTAKGEQMSRIRTRGTAAELMVRRALSRLGVRYRVNRRDLPGSPDLYISRLRLAILVNGCFWHAHDCPRGRLPDTNRKFWKEKLAKNAARDREVIERLTALGIQSLTIWSCELRDLESIVEMLADRYQRAARKSV